MALTADKSVCFAIPKILMLLLASEHNLITSDNVIHSKDYLHRVLGILLRDFEYLLISMSFFPCHLQEQSGDV